LHWEVFLLLGDKAVSGRNRETPHQGCQIFIDTIYQNGDNVTNCHTVCIPNGHERYQNDQFKGLPKCTKTGVFGLKMNHLAALLHTRA
jgi:hypothetical protein